MPLPLAIRRVAIACAASACVATAAFADGRDVRDHVTIGGGVQKFTSEPFGSDGLDQGPFGHFAFRHSLRKGLDFALEFRATWASEDIGYDPTFPFGATVTANTVWAGGCVRLSSKRDGPRPYGQLGVYFLSEHLNKKGQQGELPEKNLGAGLGAQAGVEFPLSDLLSVPIEVGVLAGKTESSMTCVHANVGLTFNFGSPLDASTRPSDF